MCSASGGDGPGVDPNIDHLCGEGGVGVEYACGKGCSDVDPLCGGAGGGAGGAAEGVADCA